MSKFGIFLAGLMFLVVLCGAVSATTYVSECGTLDVPGETYVLINDIITSGTCFSIRANDTTLDGNGYTLTGNETIFGCGVSLHEKSGVAIKNLRVQKFFYGVCGYNPNNVIITNNNFSFNTWGGIHLRNSNNAVITSNELSNNRLGIRIEESNNDSIKDNTANSNEYEGILILHSNNSFVMNNTLNSNGRYGVYFYYSNDGILTDNTATSNNYNGFFFLNSNGNVVTGNVVNLNRHGILLYTSARNNVADNRVFENLRSGILLYHYSSENAVVNNDVSSNKMNGFHLYNNSNGNVITNNVVESNENYGIILEVSSKNAVYNNNFIDNFLQVRDFGGVANFFNLDKPIGGNYWSDWTIPDNDGDGFVDSPYSFTVGQDNLPWTRPNGWDDYDNDGVLNEKDACSNTPSGGLVNAEGCTIVQLCPVDGIYKNHGAYIECVVNAAENFLEEGLITEAEAKEITLAAKMSDIGKPIKSKK